MHRDCYYFRLIAKHIGEFIMRAVNIFMGADLRSGYSGLRDLLKKNKIDFNNLNSEEAYIFVNRSKTSLKVLSYNHVVSYLRSEDTNRPFDMEALNEIPRAFKADGTIDYNKALKLSLEARLLKSGRIKNLEILK